MRSLSHAKIDDAADKEVAFTFKNGTQRTFTGKSLLLTLSIPQFFFHVTTAYDILRHAGVDIAKKDFWDRRGNAWNRRCYAALLLAGMPRPVISLFNCSKRRRASLSRSLTIWIAASLDIGPLTTGAEFSPMVSST